MNVRFPIVFLVALISTTILNAAGLSIRTDDGLILNFETNGSAASVTAGSELPLNRVNKALVQLKDAREREYKSAAATLTRIAGGVEFRVKAEECDVHYTLARRTDFIEVSGTVSNQMRGDRCVDLRF